MKKLLALIVILVVLVLAFFLFRNESAAPTELSEESVEVTEIADTNVSGTGQGITVGEPNPNAPVKEFIVEGTSFAFDPKSMTVNEGDRVRVTFVNKVGVHDWKLDEFNAATKILQAGQKETIEFTATKKGTFEYYCSVGNHRQQGMVGTLTVK